ncbi:MAG: protein phosphatase 2C domain-containing protein [Oscillospiraceae bacterium]|nr:protein phosphatase 2C domain-containing protein [Oscillospiraceae bacterium]
MNDKTAKVIKGKSCFFSDIRASISEDKEKAVPHADKADSGEDSFSDTPSENAAQAAETEAEKAEDKALTDNQVTAHTSSLWKYNPIPEKPVPFPEYRCSSGQEEETGISVIAARVRGKMHKHDGSNCDDWYEYDFGGGMAFAAVSDGAGSKLYSRIGSKTACITAVQTMKEQFTEYFANNPMALSSAAKPFTDPSFTKVCTALAGLIQNSAISAAKAVVSVFEDMKNDKELTEAAGRELTLSDFACTLLITAVIPVIAEESGRRESLILSVQIGDGMTASVNSEAAAPSAISLLGEPDSGEFSGETDFITSASMQTAEAVMKRTRIQRKVCTDILMMTDGVADDYFPNSPQLLRLYLDLKANGILPVNEVCITEENRPYISRIPRPEKYRWVNDSDVFYEFQYISAVCEATGLSLEQLWSMPDVVSASSLKSFGIENSGDTPHEQLQIWLDNYVKRGSFDDRTLLIIRTDG